MLAFPALVVSGRVRSDWLRDLLCGIRGAQRALTRPTWRLSGAVGYLGFDIAVLWVAFWIPSLGGLIAYWRLRSRLRESAPALTRHAAPGNQTRPFPYRSLGGGDG